MTPLIEKHVLGPEHDKFQNVDHLDRFQTLYCAWSSRIVPDALVEKPAILALSNKGGEISLWSYSSSEGIKYQATLRPHEGFVNLVQWTNWQVNGNQHTAYIASTCTDGTVSLSSVTVHVEVTEEERTNIRSVEVSELESWFKNDRAVPTLIKVWDDVNDSRVIKIAICKGVQIDAIVIRATQNSIELEGDWARYRLANSSMGLGGADWTHDGKILYAYTCEGECLALFIHQNKIECDDRISSTMNENLLLKYKQQNMEEEAKLDSEELEFVNDMMPHFWGSAISINDLYTVFAFTLTPTVDVHYKSESRDDVWIAFTLHQERQDEATLDKLCLIYERYLKNSDFPFSYPVKGILHEPLEYLVDDESETAIKTWLSTLGELMDCKQDKEYVCMTYALSVLTLNRDLGSLTRRVYSQTCTIAARALIYIQLKLRLYVLPHGAKQHLVYLCDKAQEIVRLHYIDTMLSFALDRSDEEWKKFTDDDITTLLLFCDRALSQPERTNEVLTTTKAVFERLLLCFPDSSICESLVAATKTVNGILNGQEVEYQTVSQEECPACGEHILFR
ncbi:hypothetical protein DFQ29_009724 [Apophysomyces sp. BC1021]|nr:hypothetical protein DFQ29_009724 [Apophysomyces sp. BC1021]